MGKSTAGSSTCSYCCLQPPRVPRRSPHGRSLILKKERKHDTIPEIHLPLPLLPRPSVPLPPRATPRTSSPLCVYGCLNSLCSPCRSSGESSRDELPQPETRHEISIFRNRFFHSHASTGSITYINHTSWLRCVYGCDDSRGSAMVLYQSLFEFAEKESGE